MRKGDPSVSFHCMGCGSALARSDSLLGDAVRYLGGRDGTGCFFRCPACGGQNYYLVREGRGLVFVEFHDAPVTRDGSSACSHGSTFLRCMGAALAVLGLAKFLSEVVSEGLLPYPPVTLFTTFLAWAALYVISLVRSARQEDPSRAG